MATELKTNTAVRITVGPFLDKTDGITPEVALTVTSEKLTFVVDTGGVPTLVLDVAPTASGGANDMVHITGDDAGYYDLELAAANVNYLGRALLSLNDVATHLPVFHEFNIVSAQYWDSKYGSGNLSADLKAITAGVDFSATMKTSIETACDATVGGGTGTSLTAIPWNAAWDAEVESEVNDALVVQRLDELLNADSDIDGVAPPTVGSVFHELLTKTAGSFTYDQSTDSLEAIRDTAPLGTAMRGTDSAALASVCTEARLAELDAANLITDVANVKTDTAAILVDTGTTLDGRIPAALVSGKMDSDMRAATGAGAISSLAYELLLERVYEMINNKMTVNETTGAVVLRNLVDSANVATGNVASAAGTTTRAVLTWV